MLAAMRRFLSSGLSIPFYLWFSLLYNGFAKHYKLWEKAIAKPETPSSLLNSH